MNKEKVVLSIKSIGDTTGKNSALYDIQLGDWKLKRGVQSIHLDMVARNKPKLVIECSLDQIEVEGLEVEALLKDYWKEYQKAQFTRGGTEA
ncbi:hypothetical protein BU180_12605 [Listeria monocytogenes]|nr:hypothetical protein [Listeria monocytogenes]